MPRRSRALAASLALLGLAAPGQQGGDSAETDVQPSSGSGGSSSSGSPSASPSAARTTSATTGLEAQAPVKAVREWAAAVAQEVNARSSSHAPTKALTTRRGARTLPKLYTDYYGQRFPGPLPFTPISVEQTGRTARVPACIQSQGWAVDPRSSAPGSPELTASTFVLKKQRGAWRLDTITGRQQSCADITVKGSTR